MMFELFARARNREFVLGYLVACAFGGLMGLAAAVVADLFSRDAVPILVLIVFLEEVAVIAYLSRRNGREGAGDEA